MDLLARATELETKRKALLEAQAKQLAEMDSELKSISKQTGVPQRAVNLFDPVARRPQAAKTIPDVLAYIAAKQDWQGFIQDVEQEDGSSKAQVGTEMADGSGYGGYYNSQFGNFFVLTGKEAEERGAKVLEERERLQKEAREAAEKELAAEQSKAEAPPKRK